MKKIRELKKKKKRTQLRTHLFPFQIQLLPTKQKITSTILGEQDLKLIFLSGLGVRNQQNADEADSNIKEGEEETECG